MLRWVLVMCALSFPAAQSTRAGYFLPLGRLPGDSISIATDVSADGSVVVGSSGNRCCAGWAAEGDAFQWTSVEGMLGLGISHYIAGALPRTPAVSEDNSTTVGWNSSLSGSEAFRWTNGEGIVGLGDLAGGDFHSQAMGVSADGSVIVGWSSSAAGQEAFRWTSEGGMVGLGDLPGGTYQSSATDVSSDGSVVVGWSNSTTGQQAVVWDTKHGMRPLAAVLTSQGIDLSGWWLTAASAISADGNTIVGSGINPLGQTEAWLANISTVPEPGTVSVLFVGALVFAACYRPTNFRQMATLQGQDS